MTTPVRTEIPTEFNRRLAIIAADERCGLMKIHAPLADSEGLLRRDYSRDGLHLNEAGYRVWAGMIGNVLPPGHDVAGSSTSLPSGTGGR